MAFVDVISCVYLGYSVYITCFSPVTPLPPSLSQHCPEVLKKQRTTEVHFTKGAYGMKNMLS